MDLLLIFGLIFVFGVLVVMINIEGVIVGFLLLFVFMVLVFGVMIVVGFVSGILCDVLYVFKFLFWVFCGECCIVQSMIDMVVGYVEKVCVEGLFVLEQGLEDEKDLFLCQVLQSIVDGMDVEDLCMLFEDEFILIVVCNCIVLWFYMIFGGFVLMVGIIGMVVFLMYVLEKFDKFDMFGFMIVVVFVVMLWGLLLVNFIWLLIGGWLQWFGEFELECMIVFMEGMFVIQVGVLLQFVGECLCVFVFDCFLICVKGCFCILVVEEMEQGL